jgi:uncharacterized protein YbjT (DUF2867 family)
MAAGDGSGRLARETGIEHLVYSSLNGAAARSGIPYYESKSRIEEHIHALGVPATILRPVSFRDNSPRVSAAGGPPESDAAGDLVAHDRLETLSTEGVTPR